MSTDEDEPEVEPPTVPWLLSAAGGGVLTAVAGWLLVSLVMVLGWTAAPDIDVSSVLWTATRIWMLSYFADVTIGGLVVGVTPLGLTAVHAVLASGVSGYAATAARRAAPEELSQSERRALALRVAGVFAAAHVLTVLAASFVAVEAPQSARVLFGAMVVAGGPALVGAARATEWHPLADLPGWARPVPHAVLAAFLAMVVTGAAVLTTSLVWHRSRVEALHDSLHAGILGGVLLLVLQLLWVPNLVLWAASWATGAGFSLGQGTVVSPGYNEHGLVPAIPLLGALPAAGVGPWQGFLWMAGPVVAGVLAALVVVRARPRARFDETALVGGLAGVLAGCVVVVMAAASGGDLGTIRLVDLGPRLGALWVMAPTLMGFSGLVTGAVAGMLARVEPPGATATVEQ